LKFLGGPFQRSMSMKRLLSSLSVMNCAMAYDPESPSVECCEIIFPLLFASDGREQEPHSSCDVLSPAFNPGSDDDCVQRGSANGAVGTNLR
jgi:hypothetical protein